MTAARRFESLLTDPGVVPATIAVLDGQLKASLSVAELDRIANEDIPKLHVRDPSIGTGRSGRHHRSAAASLVAGCLISRTGSIFNRVESRCTPVADR